MVRFVTLSGHLRLVVTCLDRPKRIIQPHHEGEQPVRIDWMFQIGVHAQMVVA